METQSAGLLGVSGSPKKRHGSGAQRISQVIDFSSSDFGTRVLIIAIGRDRDRFNIHEGKLQQTSFFRVHGSPPTEEQKRERFSTPNASARGSSTTEDTPVKKENTANDDNVTVSGDAMTVNSTPGAGPAETEIKPDYHLVSRFHTSQAFKIFIDWLYNEPVPKSKNKNNNQVLRQAYILARQYRAFGLQNQILDRHREYHVKNVVVFDDLIWLVNRMADETDNALTAYLIEQIAYEITDGGFDKFDQKNSSFSGFLQTGERRVRRDLFVALARHAYASGGKLGDPAQTGSNWHVVPGPEIAEQQPMV